MTHGPASGPAKPRISTRNYELGTFNLTTYKKRARAGTSVPTRALWIPKRAQALLDTLFVTIFLTYFASDFKAKKWPPPRPCSGKALDWCWAFGGGVEAQK